MSNLNFVLIEQSLFGINNTGLSGEEFLVETIVNYIKDENPSYTLCGVLTESIQYSDYNKYIPLLEAVDEIKDAQKEEKENPEIKAKENAFKKIYNNFKKTVEWFYKIDPESKAMNLRTILEIGYSVLVFALKMYLQYKMVGVSIGEQLIRLIPFAGRHIANKKYGEKEKGNSIIKDIKDNGFKEGIKEHLSTPSGKYSLVSIIIDVIFMCIMKIDAELYYKINIKDLDENIKKYDKLVDDINSKLETEENEKVKKELEKTKRKTEDAVKKLIGIRDERTRRERKAELKKMIKNKLLNALKNNKKRDPEENKKIVIETLNVARSEFNKKYGSELDVAETLLKEIEKNGNYDFNKLYSFINYA